MSEHHHSHHHHHHRHSHSDKKKKLRWIEIGAVALLLVIAGVLIFLSKRSVTVPLPLPDSNCTWEIGSGEQRIVKCVDSGVTGPNEFTFKFTTLKSSDSEVIVLYCVDGQTREIVDSRTYNFITDAKGFLTVEVVVEP